MITNVVIQLQKALSGEGSLFMHSLWLGNEALLEEIEAEHDCAHHHLLLLSLGPTLGVKRISPNLS
jgi:hypothetical protein